MGQAGVNIVGEAPAIVIGAGVVGLAIARALAVAGARPIILDVERAIGSVTSSRNSEVVHAGIYYPPLSLKARTCVAGRERLYQFCRAAGVPHRRLGKLIVATDKTEVASLAKIAAQAEDCEVELEALSSRQAREMEPEIACEEALYSPSTGIVDSHAFMLALLGEAEAFGAQFIGGVRVTRLARTGSRWVVHVDGEPAVSTSLVVNAAGLGAQALARQTDGVAARFVPPLYLARGRYLSLLGKSPFKRLVYPVPVPGGLGIHLTLDLAGSARFGPDLEWIDGLDYSVDPALAPLFCQSVRRYWPGVSEDRLIPAYAGVRPKVTGPGEPAADFIVSGPSDHGLSGLVNLFGIESPGLTSALSLAELVASKATGSGQWSA